MGEECSRLLTPQQHQLAVEVSGLLRRPRVSTKFFGMNRTLSKRRGRSLVSSDGLKYFSGDRELMVGSATANGGTPSPLVRRLYQPAT
jgi:hypothetical protein